MGKFSDKYDLNKAKLLRQLIEKSYKKGNFTLSSGKQSSHYLNCKPVSLNGEGLHHLMTLVYSSSNDCFVYLKIKWSFLSCKIFQLTVLTILLYLNHTYPKICPLEKVKFIFKD